ncbi:MAG TPA: prepilin peptidase [Chloroflexi bacterium]|nr:prepilin peptidase [Chloroflexota bacterium]
MEILGIFLFALLGLVVGSFLNVCIDRLPQDKSIAYPPSHCEACQHRLAVKDLVPVFSYLRLRGRCRYCQSAISRRIFWVELATGLIFAFLYWWCVVFNPELGIVAFWIMAFYACLFTVVFVIDLEHGLILNKVVYPGMVVALLLALVPQPWITRSIVTVGVANAALGGAIGFVIFFLIAIIFQGSMGWGDVKLVGLIGLAAGFPLIIISIIMAGILGGVVALALVIARKRNFKGTIPFGPFLTLAAMITLLWGSNILSWYLPPM